MRLSTKNLGRRSMMLVAFVFMTLSAVAADLNWTFTFAPADINLSASGQYTVITLADGSNPRDAVGAPAIPAKFANILLPSGATDVTVSATGDLVLLASDVTPWPTQRVAPKSRKQPPFAEPDPVAYASANPWPAVAATYEGLHEMQGSTFVSVRVNPLVYVASEKALYYRPQVTVTVSYKEPDAQRNNMRTRLGATAMVNALVVNPSTTDAALRSPSLVPASERVDYLIVTSNSLKTAFQALADYRATGIGGGYKTLVVTTEDIKSKYSVGDTQEKIRNYIKDYYDNHGTKFVVLGGDDSVVPDRDTYAKVGSGSDITIESHMPTDLYYSDLDGTWKSGNSYGKTEANVDMSPEVIVGRIPVRTADQATGYIAKVQAFEADLSHTRNSIIMGGPAAWCRYSDDKRPSDDVTGDGHLGFRDEYHGYVSDSEMWLRRLYRDGIKQYWDNAEQATGRTINLACDAITSWDTANQTSGNKVLSANNLKTWLDNGYTHLMFSGHGYPQGWGLEGYNDYSTTQASSQTNLTAFVYTDACLTAAFDGTSLTLGGYSYSTEPCLGEAFIRNAKGGALVHMGCSRYGWGTPDYLDSDPDTQSNDIYTDCTASNYSDGGPSTVYAYKFYKRLYEQDAVAENRTVGEAFAMSKADMISQCSSYDCERWIQFGLNYLGDPAIALYPRSTDPMISVAPKSVDFKGTYTDGMSKSETVSVKGYNLTGGVTVTLNDPSGIFSVNPQSISKTEAEDGVDVTVTWTPTAVGNTSATITFSSEGAEDVVVNLTGTAKEAPHTNPDTKTFKLVASTDDLQEGMRYIIACGSENTAAGALGSQILSAVDVINKDGIITINNDVAVFVIEEGDNGWTFKNESTKKYLYATAAKKLAYGETASSWTLSNGTDGVIMTYGDLGTMLYNANSPRFTTYTSDPNISMIQANLYMEDSEAVPAVTVPTLTVTEADITASTAPVAWNECQDVTEYTLQLASDDQFAEGGAAKEETLIENDATSATVPADWIYNISSKTSSYLILFKDHSVVSAAFNTSAYNKLVLTLKLRTYGGTTDTSNKLLVEYSADGTNWVELGTISASTNSLVTKTLDISDAIGNQSVRLRFTDPGAVSNMGVGLSNIVVTGTLPPTDATLISTTAVEGTSYTFTGLTPNTTYYARVKGNADWSNVVSFTTTAAATIELVDDGTDNVSIITTNHGKKANVTLAGRTFYKDGEWNTVCLPFDLPLEGSPLADAEAKMLTDATMTGTNVKLQFGPAQGTLEAGVPYIIRWTGGDNIVEPTFTGVTINGAMQDVSLANGHVQFKGYYNAFGITADNTDIYYMGTGSTLKHTAKPRTLKACRAYFSFTPEALSRDISIDFGEGEAKPTGVGAALMNNEERIMNNEVYDLQGRRIDGSRFTVNGARLNRGIYIKNGRKVVVK